MRRERVVHTFAARVAGLALLAVFGWGCGSSMCSLDREQRGRLEKLRQRARAIQEHQDLFPDEYVQRAKDQSQRLKQIERGFDCKETDPQEILRSVDDQLDLLSDAALPRCLARAASLMKELDRARIPAGQLRERYDKERGVGPAELARLSGCLEHVSERQALLDAIREADRQAQAAAAEARQTAPGPEAGQRPESQAGRAVARLEAWAGEDWWTGGVTPEQLKRQYDDALAEIGKLDPAVSSGLKQRADAALERANRRYQHALDEVTTSLAEATERCDKGAFEQALRDLQKFQPDDELVRSKNQRFEDRCSAEGEAAKWVDRIKNTTDDFMAALSSGDARSLRRSMASVIDLVTQIRDLDESLRTAIADKGVRLDLLFELGDYVRHVQAADSAIDRGRWAEARRELAAAAASRLESQMKLAAPRRGKVDRLEGRAKLRQGNFAAAWTLFARAAGSVDVRADQAETALAALASASDPHEVLLWARRAQNLGVLRRADLASLIKVMEAAARPGSSSSDLAFGLEVLQLVGKRPGGVDRRTILVAGALLHRVALAGNVPGSELQSYLDRLVDEAAGRMTASQRFHLSNLLIYHEIAQMIRSAVEGVVEETAGLPPDRARRIRDRLIQTMLSAASKNQLLTKAVLLSSDAEVQDPLLRRAMDGNGWALSEDGSSSVLITGTSAGRIALVFRLPRVGSADPSEVAAALRSSEAEALGIVAALRIQMISGRTDRPVAERKAAVRDLIQGIRFRMGGVVLAYAGLFNSSGDLEVPRRARDFFLAPELKKGADPVFQDKVSRAALQTVDVKHQRYRLGPRLLEDVAVAVKRGRNRVGVLRLGVFMN